jgi:hypothetical protein
MIRLPQRPVTRAAALGGFSVLVFLIAWAAITASRAHDSWRARRSERRMAARTGTFG